MLQLIYFGLYYVLLVLLKQYKCLIRHRVDGIYLFNAAFSFNEPLVWGNDPRFALSFCGFCRINFASFQNLMWEVTGELKWSTVPRWCSLLEVKIVEALVLPLAFYHITIDIEMNLKWFAVFTSCSLFLMNSVWQRQSQHQPGGEEQWRIVSLSKSNWVNDIQHRSPGWLLSAMMCCQSFSPCR